jgi:hypothetical protein
MSDKFEEFWRKLLDDIEAEGARRERQRIISLLIELNAIRRDALGDLVAFNTDGTEVIYLTGLEEDNK